MASIKPCFTDETLRRFQAIGKAVEAAISEKEKREQEHNDDETKGDDDVPSLLNDAMACLKSIRRSASMVCTKDESSSSGVVTTLEQKLALQDKVNSFFAPAPMLRIMGWCGKTVTQKLWTVSRTPQLAATEAEFKWQVLAIQRLVGAKMENELSDSISNATRDAAREELLCFLRITLRDYIKNVMGPPLAFAAREFTATPSLSTAVQLLSTLATHWEKYKLFSEWFRIILQRTESSTIYSKINAPTFDPTKMINPQLQAKSEALTIDMSLFPHFKIPGSSGGCTWEALEELKAVLIAKWQLQVASAVIQIIASSDTDSVDEDMRSSAANGICIGDARSTSCAPLAANGICIGDARSTSCAPLAANGICAPLAAATTARTAITSILQLFLVLGVMPKLRNVGTNMRTAVKIALGSADVFNNEGYLSIFETPLLQVMRERSEKQRTKWLAGGVPREDYLCRALALCKQNDDMAYTIGIPQQTVEKLAEIQYSELLAAPSLDLLASQFAPALRTSYEELLTMGGNSSSVSTRVYGNTMLAAAKAYVIPTKVPHLATCATPCASALAQHLREFMTSVGQDILATYEYESEPPSSVCVDKRERAAAVEKRQMKLIEALVQLHKWAFEYLEGYCGSSPVIVRMLHGVMEVLFSSNTIVLFSNNGADEGGGGNDESLSVPEMLAKYMDGVLRGRVKDVDVLRLVPLVSFVTAKDLFFEEYRQALASRLLSNVSSLEDEQEVISHMKALCGGGMSSLLIKHETMITNVVMANEEKDSFESDDGLKLNMRVLTSSHWPSFLSLSCPLPPDMQHTFSTFSKWYTDHNPKHKLSLVFSQGTAEVRATFTKGAKTFSVTTMQAMVLCMFNEHTELSMRQMMDMLGSGSCGITMDIVMRIVHPMVLSKPPCPLLLVGGGKTLNADSKIAFNATYESPKMRIVLPSVPLVASSTKKTVTEDRKFQIQASVVRCMKSRKRLGHTELIAEVIKQLSHQFKPDVVTIKREIEGLIEREFLERDENTSNVYLYVA